VSTEATLIIFSANLTVPSEGRAVVVTVWWMRLGGQRPTNVAFDQLQRPTLHLVVQLAVAGCVQRRTVAVGSSSQTVCVVGVIVIPKRSDCGSP
jgi:hypothetical protein